MSKKNLLNETTIRRFMKLANMETLTSPFVDRLDEMGHAPAGRDEELDEAAHEDLEEAAHEDKPVEEMYHGDRDEDLEEAAHDELDADMDAPAAEAEIPADVRDRIEDALAAALEDLAGKLDLDLDVEREDDAAPEMDAAPEADVGADLDADDDAVDADADDLLEGVEVVDDAALINEVAKRVTARLVKAMAKK